MTKIFLCIDNAWIETENVVSHNSTIDHPRCIKIIEDSNCFLNIKNLKVIERVLFVRTF